MPVLDNGEALAVFVEELKLSLRCVALCMVHHSTGGFFVLGWTWPNPIVETNEYKELQRKPGVYCATTDEDG